MDNCARTRCYSEIGGKLFFAITLVCFAVSATNLHSAQVLPRNIQLSPAASAAGISTFREFVDDKSKSVVIQGLSARGDVLFELRAMETTTSVTRYFSKPGEVKTREYVLLDTNGRVTKIETKREEEFQSSTHQIVKSLAPPVDSTKAPDSGKKKLLSTRESCERSSLGNFGSCLGGIGFTGWGAAACYGKFIYDTVQCGEGPVVGGAPPPICRGGQCCAWDKEKKKCLECAPKNGVCP